MPNDIDCKLIIRRDLTKAAGWQGLRLAASNPSWKPRRDHQLQELERLTDYRELMGRADLSEGGLEGPALPKDMLAFEYMGLAPFREGDAMGAIHRLESHWHALLPHFRDLAATFPGLRFDMTYLGVDEGFCGAVVAAAERSSGATMPTSLPSRSLSPCSRLRNWPSSQAIWPTGNISS